MIKDYFYIFIISFLGTVILTTWIKRWVTKYRIFDFPGRGKIHTQPIPTLGGLGIYFAFLLSILFGLRFNIRFRREFLLYFNAFFWSGLFTIILGLIKDIIGIPAFKKLFYQFLIGLILFFLGIRLELDSVLLSLVITVFWVVFLMNAINLIDGLDGLASGFTIISSIAFLFISLDRGDIISVFLIISLIGACGGFLIYNFYPAKIFMGDTGSMFLGLMLAIISIFIFNSTKKISEVLAIPIILGLPIYDTLTTFIRRLIRKRPIFVADGRHIYHWLIDRGLSFRRTVATLYLLSISLGLLANIIIKF